MTYKMICLDADGVIFKGKEFWIDVHRAFGTYEQGKALTDKYLHTDYNKLVQTVVYKLWKGKDARPYFDLLNSREYMKGIEELFEVIKKKKWICTIISGGSLALIKRVQKDFGADYVFANDLIIKDGKIDGYDPQVEAGFEKKADIIKDLCKKLKINPREVIYIGDSNYDLNAFQLAGKTIAFNSDSDELKKCADIIVDSNNLRDVLPYLEN